MGSEDRTQAGVLPDGRVEGRDDAVDLVGRDVEAGRDHGNDVTLGRA